MIHAQGMMTYIAQILKEGNKSKAQELYSAMGLPDTVAKDLCSNSPSYTVTNEEGTENVLVSPIRHRQITLAELKSRLSFLGYSVKKSGDEYEVYPNRKRGEASYFTTCSWDAYLTAKADSIQRFTVKLDNIERKIPEEIYQALIAWFESNGKDWKDTLLTSWYNGNYNGFKYSGELQRLRNTFGHELLHELC